MKIKTIIIIAAAVVLIGAAGFAGYFGYTKLVENFEVRVSAAESAAEKFAELYGEAEGAVTAYAAAGNLQYGAEIQEEDFYEITIPEQFSAGLVTDPGELIGKYYRVNVSEGTALSYDVIMDFPQSHDERAFDVIVDFTAIGLEINDFIDIRINLPLGEDYIAIAHKRVVGLFGNVIKVVMSEFDITVYNSLIVDAALFDGTIYATKYLEPGSQNAAEAYYPIAPNVLQAALNDPNIPEYIDYETILKRRENMEDALTAVTEDTYIRELLKQSKSNIPQIIRAGDSDYRTQKEIERQREIEEAILRGESG